MQIKKYKLSYGNSCTVLPSEAVEKIINGSASLTDIRVLMAFLKLYSVNCEIDIEEVASMCTVTASTANNSIAFWRGTGIISSVETVKTSDDVTPNEEIPQKNEEKTEEKEVKKLKLKSSDAPKYDGNQISEMIGKDGGKLKFMIDECQQLMGKMFNSTEIGIVVGMSDWLGLPPEFITTLTAYYKNKKPGCNIRYIERAATDLVNMGITTLEDLDKYLREMELYDGVAGKLRSWLGIGTRAYTKQENGYIRHWAVDFGYTEDVIKYAYEITVDSKGDFIFAYADKILENWFNDGIKTVKQAEDKVNSYKAAKSNSVQKGGSFDTDEFFGLALKRSYKNMKKTN